MLDRKQEEQKSKYQGYFEEIYQTAKNGQWDKLDNLMKISCIDERQGYFTPGSKLAAEGYLAKAEQLIRYYGASPHMIARGAAFGGFIPFCEYLHDTYGALEEDIIYGGAVSATINMEFVNKRADPDRLLKGAFIRGLTMRGDVRQAEALLEEEKEIPPEQIMELIFIAAQGRQYNFADKLGMRIPTDAGTALYKCLGAGMAGDRDYIKKNRQKIIIHNIEFPLHYAAYLAGIIGRAEIAEDMCPFASLNESVIRDTALLSMAVSRGQFRYVENLLERRREMDVSLNSLDEAYHTKRVISILSYTAMNEGYFNFINKVYCEDKSAIKLDLLSNRISTERFPRSSLVMFSLNQIWSSELRVALAEHCEAKKIIDNKQLKQIQRNYQIQQQYNLSVRELSAWQTGANIWFMECVILVKNKKLTPEIFIKIATYLSPITYQESAHVAMDMVFAKNKEFLMKDLKEYIGGFFTKSLKSLYKPDHKTAETALEKCTAVTNNAAMVATLEREFKCKDRAHDEIKHIKTEESKRAKSCSYLLFSHYRRFEKSLLTPIRKINIKT